MNEHDQLRRSPPTAGGFWNSRSCLVLCGFLAIVGLVLVFEHRVHIFTGTGILIALLALCVGMHLFMHGGHGRHGDESDRPDQGDQP